MNAKNGLRIIEEILYGVDEYFFCKNNGLDKSCVHGIVNHEYVNSPCEYDMLFDLSGGIKEWLKKNNVSCEIDENNAINNLAVILSHVGIACNSDFQDEKDSLSYRVRLIGKIISSGIYDNVFKSFKTEETCLEWMEYMMNTQYAKIWCQDGNLTKETESIIEKLKKRIHKMFSKKRLTRKSEKVES